MMASILIQKINFATHFCKAEDFPIPEGRLNPLGSGDPKRVRTRTLGACAANRANMKLRFPARGNPALNLVEDGSAAG